MTWYWREKQEIRWQKTLPSSLHTQIALGLKSEFHSKNQTRNCPRNCTASKVYHKKSVCLVTFSLSLQQCKSCRRSGRSCRQLLWRECMVCSLSTGVKDKVDRTDRNEQAGRGIKCANRSRHLSSLSTAPHHYAVVMGMAPHVVPGRWSGLLDSLWYQGNWSLTARSTAIHEKAVVA